MAQPKPLPIDSLENLRTRVERLLRSRDAAAARGPQLFVDSFQCSEAAKSIVHPTKSIGEFLDFLSDAVPLGDVYLFGGVLRDLALLGRRGFNSDVDLVVEGQWSHCVRYLESIGAKQNKFGGFRLQVAGWMVDVWNAEETWAIEQGLVRYRSIASLTETTVLNWDAILMNWRTKQFIHRERYVEQVRERVLDIVLKENPNPLGMLVRVLRHLCVKDARQISIPAIEYLAEATTRYPFDDVRRAELGSYGDSVIEFPVYRLFEHVNISDAVSIGERYGIATETLRRELSL